jgi:excisionase family DNA binding protein
MEMGVPVIDETNLSPGTKTASGIKTEDPLRAVLINALNDNRQPIPHLQPPISKPPQPHPAEDMDTVHMTKASRADLERHTAQRLNYRMSEVAALLGVQASYVTKLLSDGHLQSIVMGDGVRWIRSDSIYDWLVRTEIQLTNRKDEEEEEKRIAAEEERMAAEARKVEEEEKRIAAEEERMATEARKVEEEERMVTEARKVEEEKIIAPRALPSTQAPIPVPIPSPAPAATRLHNQYWYFIDGADKGFTSLREALQALGLSERDSMVRWESIPVNLRPKIQRELARNS